MDAANVFARSLSLRCMFDPLFGTSFLATLDDQIVTLKPSGQPWLEAEMHRTRRAHAKHIAEFLCERSTHMNRAQINGRPLEYEVRGAGEPVVPVHGSHIADAFAPLLWNQCC